MRIPRKSRNQTSLDSEAMTPMIDVVFLLLVFFVCASIGQAPDALLPAELRGNTSTARMPQPEPEIDWDRPSIRILLSTDESGVLTVQLNAAAVAGLDDLKTRLTQLASIAPEARVILDVNDSTSVQVFVAVYDLCQSLGLKDISFAL